MERLHRLERLHVENPVYFITFCTHKRMAILTNQQIHFVCLNFFAEASKRNIFVGRYILMPDHIHLFVKPPPPAENLSIWVKSLKNCLSKELRRRGVSSPHWQKGFFDHILRSGESYSEKWLYVVENCVRAGLVKDWTDWPFQGEIHALGFDEEMRRSQTAATR
ncbi:MAG TPA: transposase [Verrucomicrobiae bacterium]|nr:transposase [Verrucomicrobiae bacterium]